MQSCNFLQLFIFYKQMPLTVCDLSSIIDSHERGMSNEGKNDIAKQKQLMPKIGEEIDRQMTTLGYL